jgi:glucokinase
MKDMVTTTHQRSLVADIGGTNARLGIAIAPDEPVRSVRRYACADHAGFAGLARAYFADTGEAMPKLACLAVAGPVSDNTVHLTNGPWSVDGDALCSTLGLETCRLINDFEALAYALPWLADDDLAAIGGTAPTAHGVRLVLGPGTGLGVATLVERAGRRIALPSEGGHIGFAPYDALEIELLRWFGQRYGRVSMERLLCGAGLEQLHQALGEIEGDRRADLAAAEIVANGVGNPACLEHETLDRFLGLLGSFAGDVALVTGAGSVFIAGGIVPRLRDLLPSSSFRLRFAAKGRFAARLNALPTALIVAETPALIGCAARLYDPMLD